MDIKKLQAVVIDALEDVKAQDIRIFDTTHLTSMFDRIAIASGTSNRQTKALAASVRDSVKSAGGTIVSMEGEGTGEWVLVDLGDMVVHIMQPAIRAYYRLEELWGDKEIKLGAAKRSATVPRKTPAKTSAHITKTAVKKTAAKTSATKTSSAKTSSSKTSAVKPAKPKTPAKKTPVQKIVVKKVAVKKVAAKKTPASRTGTARRTTTKSSG